MDTCFFTAKEHFAHHEIVASRNSDAKVTDVASEAFIVATENTIAKTGKIMIAFTNKFETKGLIYYLYVGGYGVLLRK